MIKKIAFLALILSSLVPRVCCTIAQEEMSAIKEEVLQVITVQDGLFEHCSLLGEKKLRSLCKSVDLELALNTKTTSFDRALSYMLINTAPRFLNMMLDLNPDKLIYLSSKTTPHLHKLVSTLSHRLDISPPHVYVCNDNSFINAAAAGIGQDNGLIVIGKKLFEEMTYDELVSTIAHELGHIKCNHTIKRFVAIGVTTCLLTVAGNYLFNKIPGATDFGGNKIKYARHAGILGLSGIVAYHLLAPYYRMQENQADTVELGLTQNPEALESSLTKLEQLERKHVEEVLAARVMMTEYIDSLIAKHDFKRAHELKKELENQNFLQRLLGYITSVNTHPDSSARATN